MILWTIKLIRSVRKAIAGRKHPSQLSWGVALGALVGLIPHGNLLAVVLVLLILTLRVNHAMVALVAVGVTFAAPQLDPHFDSLGRWFFEQPQVGSAMTVAWQYPLMPWTDLNNTVVMGSFLIGLSSLIPLYLITTPLFRVWAKSAGGGETVVQDAAQDQVAATESHEGNEPICRIDARHTDTAEPHIGFQTAAEEPLPVQPSTDGAPALATSGRVFDVRRVHPAPGELASGQVRNPEQPQPEQSQAEQSQQGQVEQAATSIASTAPVQTVPPPHTSRVTRVSIGAPPLPGTPTKPRSAVRGQAVTQQTRFKNGFDPEGSSVDDQHKIDEALSYLLRQLRDSQDKDAA